MKKNFKAGFTLIELLVVIAIIGILASVVLASLNSARAKGANATIKSNMANIRPQAAIIYEDADPQSYATVCANTTNALVAIALAKLFLDDIKVMKERISSLPQLALRMETFEGINLNTIINDTYNLDLDALNHSLEYQIRVANNRKRVVIIGLDEDNYYRKEEVEKIVKAYEPDQLFIIRNNEKLKAHALQHRL